MRKLMLMALSIGALVAFMAPAAAQAVELTENGTALTPGAEVTATSSNLVTTTQGGVFECGSVVLHLTVGTNGPEHVTLTQDGVATAANCELNQTGIGKGHLPATITDGTIGEMTINEAGEGEASATFIDDVYANAAHTILALSCHAEGQVSVQGVAGTDELIVNPSPLTITNPGCPPSGTIEGTFTLETSGTPVTPVELDF
jgi:hypothetical protein